MFINWAYKKYKAKKAAKEEEKKTQAGASDPPADSGAEQSAQPTEQSEQPNA